jgi:hypothetical protein
MSQPGLPRNFSYPQNKIEDFVAEAYRGVNMVTLSTFPSAELRDRGQYDLTSFDTPPAAFYISSPTEHGEYSNNRLSMSGELQRPPTSNNGSRRMSAEQPSQTPTTNDDNASYQANRPFGDGNGYSPQDSSFFQISSSSQQLGVNEGDNVRFTGSHYQQQMSQTLPSSQQHGANEGTVDDFGVNSTGPPYEQQFRSIGSPYPQQFSQGTVNPPFSQTLPPSQQLRVNEGAMDNLNANVGSTSPPYQQQFSQGSYSPPYQRQFSQGTTNPSFSQTLPSSRQLGANEGTVDDFGVNTHSSPPYQQRLSQGSSNSSFSQTLPPSHQTRVNGGTSDNFGRIVRPAAPPYEQQYFQTLPPSQQLRVNEGDVIDISPSFHSPHRQRFSQESVNSSFSQTLPPSQQLRVNEGNVIDIGPSIHSPRPQRVSQESVNSSFSQTLPPSQQPRVNEGAAGPNARSTGSQQFSQGTARSQTLPPSQQIRANEGAAMDNFGPDVRTTAHRPVSPLFSQTLPPSQKTRANEGAAVDNFGPNVRPTAHRPVSPLFSQTLPPSQKIRANEGAAVDNFGPNVRPTAHPQQETVSPLLLPPSQGNVNSSFSQTRSPYQQLREGALDNNFGSNVRLTGPADSSSTAGGRIATFQVQTRPAGSTGGYSLQDPYSDGGPPPKKGDDSSFSASVANALHEKFEDLKSETKMSPWVTHQFNDILESPPIIVEGTTRRSYTLSANAGSASGGRSDSPLPVTAPSRSNRQSPSGLVNLLINNTLQEGLPRSSIRSSVSSGLSVYHDALTAPVCEDPKNGETLSVPYSSSIRSSVSSEYHDALMAPDSRIGELLPPKTAVPFSSIRSSVYSQLSVYHDALEPECEESRNGETLPKTAVPFSVPPATTITTTTRTTALSAQNTNKEDNRHLRFGGVEDIDREIEKRVSLEKEHRVIGTYPIFH